VRCPLSPLGSRRGRRPPFAAAAWRLAICAEHAPKRSIVGSTDFKEIRVLSRFEKISSIVEFIAWIVGSRAVTRQAIPIARCRSALSGQEVVPDCGDVRSKHPRRARG